MFKRRQYFKSIMLFLAIGVILAGCAQPPVPEDNYYRLIAETGRSAPTDARLNGVLLVDRLQADGIIAGRNLAYTDAAERNQLRKFYYHFWTEPPTIMLQEQLVVLLRDSNIATRVVTPKMRVDPDYTLVGKIRRFELVRGPNPQGVLEMELGLTRDRDGAIVVLGTYHVEVDAAGDSVVEGVDALSTAFAEVFDRFIADMPPA